MDECKIIKEPSTIEKYVFCLEKQIATLTDALWLTQKELQELKSKVDTNMPINPYHEIALEGCNLSDRFFARLISPEPIDSLFVCDYFKGHDIREFCMVSSFIQSPERHVLEIVGIFMEYVYLSNAFNNFHDEFKKANGHTFMLHVVSMDRVADYMCTRNDIFKKQMVIENFPKPQMYKFDKQTNKVECVDVEWSEPEFYFKRTQLINPVIAFDGME